ncbi:MAG: hypothetical protein DI598_04970 [Pseudopedobacter saltans]|uniref:Photosynthesis system II assembly factor Ycf48/Hcf136-like domain-containing protein n=1 Tax=Pseudopedobacter saltans TaxID=151895 RepID=A0A2W5F8Z2_9SPHI|nr:MAG: hypothetical protein DI598_04970 [Pseudopedobacter saltans]
MLKCFFIAVILIYIAPVSAQQIISSAHKDGVSIRGLSILDDNNAWISGSKGTVAYTNDAGKSWNWLQVPQYENRDFRDIELLDEHTVLIMAIDTPAVILRTDDKGLHWNKVLEDKRSGMFLDAMSFNGKKAVVVGDPIEGQFYISTSNNYGKTWKAAKQTSVNTGGCFASSGTNVAWRNNDFYTVTGGKNSELLLRNHGLSIPITRGKETTGQIPSHLTQTKKQK